LIKINECKEEIKELVKSKVLGLSNFPIYKKYVHTKLIMEKEEESKKARDGKHEIRLRLLDDYEFYQHL